MPDFHLQLEELICISSSFLPGADEIVVQSRLMDISGSTPTVIQGWEKSGPYKLNNGQKVSGKNLWVKPVPNPAPDKVQLDVVMQKQEEFLQTSQAPPINVHGNQNVNIVINGPTLPGVTQPSIQITGNPVKGILSVLFENDDLGHWTDKIQGPQIQLLQAGGLIFLHSSGKRTFGKWGSEFTIEYKLVVL
jgi:hypothetical protein